MCSLNDVLASTKGAAPAMSHSFCEYGNGSMGEGVRKIVSVSTKIGFVNGIKEGVIIGIPKGRKEGLLIGVGASGAFALAVWGVAELVQFCKKNRKKYILAGQQKNIDLRLAKVQREIDDFYATHLRELTDEENEKLLNLFAKKLDILKEMSNLQYQNLCNTAA